MKFFSLLAALLAFIPGTSLPVAASISIEFHLGAIDVPAGSLGVIVTDTGGDGFEAPAALPGVPLAPGETLGLNDVIVAVFSNADLPEWAGRRGFASHIAEIDYVTLGLAEGQPWTLYVFPERSAGDPVRTGEPHVAYRPSDLSDLSANSSMGLEMPADGGAYLLALLDSSAGGLADLSTIDIAPANLIGGNGSLQRGLATEARHTYYFEMTQPGFLSISGTGGAGLRAELYHRDGQLVASNNGTLPFWFEGNLAAGYHTLVFYRDDANPGLESYEIEIASRWVRFVRPDVAIGTDFGNLLTVGQNTAPGAVIPLVSKKTRKVTGLATLANLGEKPAALSASATRGSRVFRVNYFSPGGNVTAGLTSGTFTTPALTSASTAVWVRAEFKPNKKKSNGSSGSRGKTKRKIFSSTIIARAQSDPGLYDGGGWRVRAR